MLVIERKAREGVWIGADIFVKVLEVREKRVVLGIEAPSELKVTRQEPGNFEPHAGAR